LTVYLSAKQAVPYANSFVFPPKLHSRKIFKTSETANFKLRKRSAVLNVFVIITVNYRGEPSKLIRKKRIAFSVLNHTAVQYLKRAKTLFKIVQAQCSFKFLRRISFNQTGI